MANERAEARANTLLQAWKKLKGKIEKFPNHSMMVRWRERLVEYETSLVNLKKHGKEASPTGNRVGVSLDVPLGEFQIKPQVPGG